MHFCLQIFEGWECFLFFTANQFWNIFIYEVICVWSQIKYANKCFYATQSLACFLVFLQNFSSKSVCKSNNHVVVIRCRYCYFLRFLQRLFVHVFFSNGSFLWCNKSVVLPCEGGMPGVKYVLLVAGFDVSPSVLSQITLVNYRKGTRNSQLPGKSIYF